MKPFDAHCHLYDERFDEDRIKVIEKAKKVLSGAVVVGEDPESNRKVLELCKKYPEFLFPGLAIHPAKVHLLTDKEIDAEISFIRKQKNLVCIGECGLDYMWAKKSGNYEETKKRQQETFKKLIDLANDMNLPVNTHSRWASPVVVKMLKESKAKKVILHGFVATVSEAKEAAKLDYKITIGTNISHWTQTKDYLENLPMEAFVLQTDSPALGPVEGERNEPSNISLVVKEIAKIKKIPEEKVIEITNKNVKELFGL
jgi:TatD DNase family protein